MSPAKKTPAKEDVLMKKEDVGLQMDLTMDSVDGGDVEVEVVLREESKISRLRLVGRLDSFLKDGNPLMSFDMNEFEGTDLEDDVESVKVCLENVENLGNTNINYFIFKLNREESEAEDISDTKVE